MKKNSLTIITAIFLLLNIAIPVTGKLAEAENGLPPVWQECSAQERLKALRVAQLEAYRALVERVQGFVLDSGSTVYECMLKSDQVKAEVTAVIKGATEVEPPKYLKSGMVMVSYGIDFGQIAEILQSNTQAEGSLPVTVRENKIIEAIGCGALPGSKALYMLRAKRAAELDAYRMMAERFIGLKINGKTSIADMALNNDSIKASIAAYLRGLKPVRIEYAADGICKVTMQLKVHETVKVIDKIINTYNTGRSEKIEKANTAANDRIFTVTGYGAPRTSEVKESPQDIYQTEKSIIRQLIEKNVVVD